MNPWRTAWFKGRESILNVRILNRLRFWACFLLGPPPTTPAPTTPSPTARGATNGVSPPYWGSVPSTTSLPSISILPASRIFVFVIYFKIIIFINWFFITIKKIIDTYLLYMAIFEVTQANSKPEVLGKVRGHERYWVN